jgi:hypothetical protein
MENPRPSKIKLCQLLGSDRSRNHRAALWLGTLDPASAHCELARARKTGNLQSRRGVGQI